MSGHPTFSTWLKAEGPDIASDDAPHLLQPGVTLDGWRIISFIARGGNADVYRAEHTELKTIAAIKTSIADTSESLARFKQEAQILGSVHHEALPVFHAPEQFTGEEITPASDIHALGVLLNECFDGMPPRHWKRIIAKCTSSLPDYRFHTAQEFIQAVQHRNLRRVVLRTLFTLLALGLIATLVIIPSVIRQRERERVQKEERQRKEEDVRRAQESLMREVQLIMNEK